MRKPLKHGHKMKRPGLAVIRRFLSKVEANGMGCWDWQGTTSGRETVPYGQIRVDGKVRWAHRVSYAIFNGGLLDGLDVHHTCENTLCVNPAHLKAETRSEHGVIEAAKKRDGVPF